MWKVPYDGSIAITGDAKLTDNLSGFRSKTRTYDGVRLAIQARDTVYLDSLLLPGEQKNMYCLILGIKKGDSIFFRINARDKRLYDQVEWTPHIQYLTAIHSNGASFLSSKVDELGLKTICTLEGTDHKIAETIRDNTETKDQDIIEMNSLQSTTSKDVEEGASYLSVMEGNLEVLKKALD